MPFRESAFRAENKQFSTESKIEENVGKYEEKIEDGVWEPSIFDRVEDLGVGMSTKDLGEMIDEENSRIKITPDMKEFNRKYYQIDRLTNIANLATGLLKVIAPDIDYRNIEKTSLDHSENIVVIDEEYLRRDKTERIYTKADGMMTNLRKIPLIIGVADCPSVMIYDPTKKIISLLHSGWQSTLKQISSKGVKKMENIYGSKPEKLLVAIGPYAGVGEPGIIKGLEVGKDILDQFQKARDENGYLLYTQEEIQSLFVAIKDDKKKGKYFFDIGQAIVLSLTKAGVSEENVQVSQYSTTSEEGNRYFPSLRKEGKTRETDSSVCMVVLR